SLRLRADTLPLYAGALEAAEAGTRTGGDARNRSHLEGRVDVGASPALAAVAFDPQTSGGLLAAVTPGDADGLVADHGFTVVGDVAEGPAAVSLR
ncbi:MAG: selenide, water dikinase SelD, partial [Actinomycetota bacterium]|nr:selenide, water dikinase SelD [Actinomycetota bacterium]